jgi:serine/threonine protein kinase
MSERKKRCPYCDEMIRANAKKCRHCGSTLLSEEMAPGDSATTLKLALGSRFEVKEEVGRGGMALVFKAVQKNLNRTVALKVLAQNMVLDKEFLERFHQEARQAAQLAHPSIVTVLDDGVSNGVHFIAMEFLDGYDLHTVIKQRGTLTLQETIAYMMPIAQALDYAHSKEVIHRDVKSSNIFLTASGRSVLTDFGIAHAATGAKLTQTGSIIGTPEYMSPEQAEGKPVDYRSDIYSFGIVLFEMLSGTPPFQADSPVAVAMMQVHSPITFPVTIPQAIQPVLAACLAKDPEERQASCQTVIVELMHPEKMVRIQRKTGAGGHGIVRYPPDSTESVHAVEKASIRENRSDVAVRRIVAILLLFSITLLIFVISHKQAGQTGVSATVSFGDSTNFNGRRESNSLPQEEENAGLKPLDQQQGSVAQESLRSAQKKSGAGAARSGSPSENLDDGLYLRISVAGTSGGNWYGFVISSRDPQLGNVLISKDESGRACLNVDGREITRQNIGMSLPKYIYRHALPDARNLSLPRRIRFSQTGEFIIVALKLAEPLSDSNTEGDVNATIQTIFLRQIDISSDGAVANSDGMEIVGKGKVVLIDLN